MSILQRQTDSFLFNKYSLFFHSLVSLAANLIVTRILNKLVTRNVTPHQLDCGESEQGNEMQCDAMNAISMEST